MVSSCAESAKAATRNKLKDYLELLDYKAWYYEMAVEAGTTAIDTNCIATKRIMPRIIK
jgi:hypothetical protein